MIQSTDIIIVKGVKNKFITLRKSYNSGDFKCPYCNSTGNKLKIINANMILCKKCHKILK